MQSGLNVGSVDKRKSQDKAMSPVEGRKKEADMVLEFRC